MGCSLGAMVSLKDDFEEEDQCNSMRRPFRASSSTFDISFIVMIIPTARRHVQEAATML